MIPSLEGWPTKAKEAPFPHEVRLTPLDTSPVFQCLGDIKIFHEMKRKSMCKTYDINVHFFVKKGSPSEKNVIVALKTDDIGNLEDSPKLVFIDEECGNLIVVSDGEGLTENKEVRHFTIAYICPLGDKCCRGEYFFSNRME